MNRNLLRNLFRGAHWMADPESPGGASPAPAAGGEASATPTAGGEASAPAAEPKSDPYATDNRIHPSLRSPAAEPAASPETPAAPAAEATPSAPDPKDLPDRDPETGRWKKRVDTLTFRARELERQLTEREAELARLRQPAPKDGQPGTDAGPLPEGKLLRYEADGKPLRPTEADFADPETGLVDVVRFAEAAGAYAYESRDYERSTQAKQAEQQDKDAATWERAEETFRKTAPDYDAATDALHERLLGGEEGDGRLLHAGITYSQSPELAYTIATDDALRQRLLTIRDPRLMGEALRAVQARLIVEGVRPKTAPTNPPQPKPPPVPPKLPHGGGGSEAAITRESFAAMTQKERIANWDKAKAAMEAGTF
jgi:hypothetical protein